MKNEIKLPLELDTPEKQHIGIGIFYGLVAFFVLPYFVYFLLADLQDPVAATWFEFAYHVINFCMALVLFREYLADSFFMFRLQVKEYLFSIKVAILWVVGILVVVYVSANLCQIPWLFDTLLAVYPFSEMELLFVGEKLVWYNPLLGFLGAVVLAPVTVTCMFYCVAFAPVYNVRPWLGYLAVIAWIGFTHINNAVTYWDVFTELSLFVLQLPIHIIACWSYRRTNNICAPIVILVLTNLLAWCHMFVQMLIAG